VKLTKIIKKPAEKIQSKIEKIGLNKNLLIFKSIREGRLDLVRVLVEKNPELMKIDDGGGRTPLQLATEFGFPEVEKFLSEKKEEKALSCKKSGQASHCTD
jgi:hypothetical protein